MIDQKIVFTNFLFSSIISINDSSVIVWSVFVIW